MFHSKQNFIPKYWVVFYAGHFFFKVVSGTQYSSHQATREELRVATRITDKISNRYACKIRNYLWCCCVRAWLVTRQEKDILHSDTLFSYQHNKHFLPCGRGPASVVSQPTKYLGCVYNSMIEVELGTICEGFIGPRREPRQRGQISIWN